MFITLTSEAAARLRATPDEEDGAVVRLRESKTHSG
jgi:hypothetical protein